MNKTLYIPLYGKASVSKKGILLKDKKAEIIHDLHKRTGRIMDIKKEENQKRDHMTMKMHYWKGSAYKQILQLILYRSIIVPFIMAAMAYFALPPFAEGEELTSIIMLSIVVAYILFGKWLGKRTNGQVIIDEYAMTWKFGRKKIVIPWDDVVDINYIYNESLSGITQKGYHSYRAKHAHSYTLIIQTKDKYYRYHDIYERLPIPDAEGEMKLRLMPLHVLRDILILEWKKEGK